MRFVVTGEWRENRLLALILIWFLVFGIGVWLINLLLYIGQSIIAITGATKSTSVRQAVTRDRVSDQPDRPGILFMLDISKVEQQWPSDLSGHDTLASLDDGTSGNEKLLPALTH